VHIEAAYSHFSSLEVPFNSIDTTTFPIPTDSGLFKALKDAEQKVKFGLGLTVLRGLPVRRWERTKQIAIFAGISSYIGAKRIKQGKQNIVHLRHVVSTAKGSIRLTQGTSPTWKQTSDLPSVGFSPQQHVEAALTLSCQGPD
jgi:hypothetical protein